MGWPLFDFGSAPPYQQILDYNGTDQVVYIGWATPGSATSSAVWKVRRLTYTTTLNGSSQVSQIQYMNGDAGFHQIWDNRVTTDGVSTIYK